MKQKLCILTLSLSSGGTERFIVNVLPKLIEDFDVHLFLFFNDFHYNIPESVQTTCFSKKNNLSRIQKQLLFPFIVFKYYQYLKKNDIKISLSFLPQPNYVNSVINTLNPKVRCILSERNFPTNMLKLNRSYSYLYPFFYNKADALFSNSEYINRDLRENFNLKIPMDVIYNPVQQSERMSRPVSETFRIMNVGSFQPYRKNQELLINTAKIIKNVVPFHIHFYGEGTEMKQLSNKVDELRLTSQVSFHGKVNEIFEEYKKADIFVLSSNSEGFPNALLEAMSVGLPVISTNCNSGPLEMLNDNDPVIIEKYEFLIVKHGILINLNDDIALAKAIKYLYTNKEAYKALSQKAFERTKNYSIEKVYKNLYNKLLNSKSV